MRTHVSSGVNSSHVFGWSRIWTGSNKIQGEGDTFRITQISTVVTKIVITHPKAQRQSCDSLRCDSVMADVTCHDMATCETETACSAGPRLACARDCRPSTWRNPPVWEQESGSRCQYGQSPNYESWILWWFDSSSSSRVAFSLGWTCLSEREGTGVSTQRSGSQCLDVLARGLDGESWPRPESLG